MQKNFIDCKVKDEHKVIWIYKFENFYVIPNIFMQDYIHFHTSDTSIPWSTLFLTMEGAKKLFIDDILSDYSVSETTLEEVFISFAKHQREDLNQEDSKGGLID